MLGMLLALAMHRAIFGRGLIRTSALVPYGIVTVVAAFAWRLAFSKADGGFVPAVLHLQNDPLITTWSTYLTAILAEVWKTTPFMALLLLAGLALVPDELHEAARVDGASAWQRFWKITIPLMKPAILVALLFRTLDAFRIFDTVYVLSNGSNRSIETVSQLGYNTLLTRLNLGLGSAVCVLVFICVLIIAFLYVALPRRQPRPAGRWAMTLDRKRLFGWGARRGRHRRRRARSRCCGCCRCRSRPRPPSTTAGCCPSRGPSTTTAASSTRTSSPTRCATRSASR